MILDFIKNPSSSPDLNFCLLTASWGELPALCSAAGTAGFARVRAERHRNSVAMSDHRSTTVRHGLFSARSMQVILPDKTLPSKEAPIEPIISFLKFAVGWLKLSTGVGLA